MSALRRESLPFGIWFGVMMVALVAALGLGSAGASSALAATECGNGLPTNIQGQGSSLQRIAQQEWTGREVPTALGVGLAHAKLSPERAYAQACPGGTTVSYTSTSSGEGLTAFRFNGFGSILNGGSEPEKGFAFVGSDDGPTLVQVEDAEAATNGEITTGANPLIIPVAETSIAVIIHPPSGCKFKEGKTHGITYKHLNEVFAGTLKEWSGFGSHVEGGMACENPITRVVREDNSGTSMQFKNYLSMLETGQSAAGPGCTLGTWKALRESVANTIWPECAGTTVVRRKKGGALLAEFVHSAEGEGTIGYVALPDAKGKSAEVARLQNTTKVEFALPENGTASNCGERIYTVPTERASGNGEGEGVVWHTTFGAAPTAGGALYPLCTLTYDIAWSSYEKAGYGNAANIAADVKKYIGSYVLGAGQTLLGEHFYQALPHPVNPTINVLAAAEMAASKIG
jgi:ABC-type phosphate transport system substrate-binding protein